MGRTPGERERVSEAKIRACRENAKKPRRRIMRPLREIMHEILDPVIAKHAFPRLAAMLSDPETAPEVWLRAFECAVDRMGLPRLQQQHVVMDSTPVLVRLEGEGSTIAQRLEWPGMGTNALDAGGGGGGGERADVGASH